MRKMSDLIMAKKGRDKQKRSRKRGMHAMPDGTMMKGASHPKNGY